MQQSVISNTFVSPLLEEVVERLVAGKTNKASARCDFMLSLRRIGLWRLSTDEDWLNTIIDVNTELRQGYRQYVDGIRDGVLLAFPCAELFTLSVYRSEPHDWKARWVKCGGILSEGRMVARKDSPVWNCIGDFGYPFPPYALRSGVWTKDVLRSEAARLGVIELRQCVCPRGVTEPKLFLFEPTTQPV